MWKGDSDRRTKMCSMRSLHAPERTLLSSQSASHSLKSKASWSLCSLHLSFLTPQCESRWSWTKRDEKRELTGDLASWSRMNFACLIIFAMLDSQLFLIKLPWIRRTREPSLRFSLCLSMELTWTYNNSHAAIVKKLFIWGWWLLLHEKISLWWASLSKRGFV